MGRRPLRQVWVSAVPVVAWFSAFPGRNQPVAVCSQGRGAEARAPGPGEAERAGRGPTGRWAGFLC